MIRSVTLAIENLVARFMFQPAVCGLPLAASPSSQATSVFDDMSIWFAVPKQKVSHSKKRLKQAHKNVMRHKENICTCPRTGEVTLKHKLPFNWKDYIPTFEYEPKHVNQESTGTER